MSDGGIYGSVELHFAVDKPIGMVLLDLIDDVINLVEIRVLAAGTVGGVGKHGDAGLVLGVGLIGDSGIFNDSVELFFSGDFVDAAVGEGEDLFIFLADETAGEIVGLDRDVSFASENDVARGKIDAGDEGIGLVLL